MVWQVQRLDEGKGGTFWSSAGTFETKERYKIGCWAASLCNLKYDWFGVVKFVIGFIWQSKMQYFCSEGVTWSFQKEYYGFLNGIPPFLVPPARFAETDELQTVWEGVIS